MMSVSIEDERTTTATSKARRHGKARSAFVFFLWVIIISAELVLLVSVHQKSDRSTVQAHYPTPRKSGSFQKVNVHAPPGQGQLLDPNGDPDTLYEEDKRIVHTGPNPLHN